MNYLWPTTRGWVVVLSGIVWLFVALVNGTLFALFFAWACFSLMVVSMISAWCSLKGISIKRGSPGHAIAGQKSSLPFEVKNSRRRRRQPFFILEKLSFVASQTQVSAAPSLGPRENALVERDILPLRRGEFQLNAVTLRSGDPAGLFCRQHRIILPDALLIYPAIESIEGLRLEPEATTSRQRDASVATTGLSQDFYGIRDYVPTDGLRRIHWRSSARQRKLMSREFERASLLCVAIVLDVPSAEVCEKGGENLEALVKTAASLVHACGAFHCLFACAIGGQKPLFIQPQDITEIHEEIQTTLARLDPGTDNAFSENIETWGLSLPRGSVVFYLSLDCSDAVRLTVENLLQSGLDLRWIAATKPVFSHRKTSKATTWTNDQSPLLSPGGLCHPVLLEPDMTLTEAFSRWSGSRLQEVP